MGLGPPGTPTPSDIKFQTMREESKKTREEYQTIKLSSVLKDKLILLSNEKQKFLEEIKKEPINSTYTYDSDRFKTTYENYLYRIDVTNAINAQLQKDFSQTLNEKYVSQYKKDSMKYKYIHITIVAIIMFIICLIVLVSKVISGYWLFLFVPIIIIIGYKSYNIFKRRLVNRYIEKQNKRENILKNINNLYNSTNTNSLTPDEEQEIRNIFLNSREDKKDEIKV